MAESPIARRPAGLLDLVLTQQQGKNPDQLGNVVVPMMDITAFYNQEVLATISSTFAMTGPNNIAVVEVPPGEAWRLIAVTMRGPFVTINQWLTFGFQVARVAGTSIVELCSHERVAKTANDRWGGGFFDPAGGVIYPSGTRIQVLSQSINLDGEANITGTYTVLYAKMST